MKIFVSWSGERSRALAQALHEWLPLVLHYVEPWMSHADIEAGERWAVEVARELETSNFGIVCITEENLASPWILFETGALAKSLLMGRAIPLLLDVEFSDISGPLAQFQAKKLEKGGVFEVLNSINNLAELQVPEARLRQIFEVFWPQLESKTAELQGPASLTKPHRPLPDVLEELVSAVRGLETRFREMPQSNILGNMSEQILDLFQAVKIFDKKIDAYYSDSRQTKNNRKLARRALVRSSRTEFPIDPITFLMLISALRDSMPWIYELGMDYVRIKDHEDDEQKIRTLTIFAKALAEIRNSPDIQTLFDDSDAVSVFRALEDYLTRFGIFTK